MQKIAVLLRLRCKEAFRVSLHLFVAFGLFGLVSTQNAMASAGVASATPLATAAGVKILAMGGNAFDAAVAVSAVLAVVEPAGSGLGGGGFWLLHDAEKGKDILLDGREKAPLAASRDMYLDHDGNVVAKLSVDGALAAAIPGEPAALVWLAENLGSLPLAVLLQPAIQLAEQGFTVDPLYRRRLAFRLNAVTDSAAAADIFLVDGKVPDENTVLVQHDLANTLKTLATAGHDGFYRGQVAQKLVAGVRAAGGLWTLADLAAYQVKVREPLVAQYKNMTVTSATLPSSGGLVLTQVLNILSGYDLENTHGESEYSTDFVHLNVEAMRRAYRDRAVYMGDSDFVSVPLDMLMATQYAATQRHSIQLDRATPNHRLALPHHKGHDLPTEPAQQPQAPREGTDTTHFSIIDAHGNRVAATLSINYPFGSGLVPPGTGVLLNDEMDDFSAKPGQPNVYGLVGGEANAIAAGKRMLSSMSPTFLDTGARVAVLGTPGGSRIISMVALAALAFQQGAEADQIVNRARFHHQYLPDAIQFERGAFTPQTIEELQSRGHKMDEKDRPWGNMHIVIQDKSSGKITAASDRRGGGVAVELN